MGKRLKEINLFQFEKSTQNVDCLFNISKKLKILRVAHILGICALNY